MRNNTKINKKIINVDTIKDLLLWCVISLMTFVILEYLSRGSILRIGTYFKEHTVSFFVNVLLLLMINGVMFLLKHKKTYLCITTFVLLSLGMISRMVLNFRGTPIAFMDIYSLGDGLSIADKFIDLKMIIIAVIIVISFVGILIFTWKIDKNKKRFNGIASIIAWLLVSLVFSIIVLNLRETGYLRNLAWDMQKSYEANGFTYSLLDSYFGYLRKAPDGYNEKNIKEIRAEVDKRESQDKRTIKDNKNKPNVLIVQLEGFMDPTQIPRLKLSMDPIPNFRKLMQENTSGYMNVPTTGGGTARTEFEVITGNSFDYLLPSEIPYSTIVREKTSNSLATTMKKQGFGVHAIHNFKGNFYNRNKGFKNLGFDTFTSVEYMNGMEYTKLGWPKDYILTKYIQKCLDSTESKDLVCTVSVQGHSYYPEKIVEKGYPCKVRGKIDEKYLNQFYYYCEQVREMDQFVKQLDEMVTERKKKTGEDTIIVYYGDHMPSLDYLYDGAEYLNRYESPYAYFSTFKIPKEENTIKDSYQIAENTLRMAGIKYGPMEKFHAYMKNDKDYLKKLELVQYDILFGEKYYLKDNEIQKENNIKMGIDDIKIKNVKKQGSKILLEGENFTERSFICLNDEILETKFINQNEISAELGSEKLKTNDKITVKQLGENDNELSRTKEFIVK